MEKDYSSHDKDDDDGIYEYNPRCPLCKTSHRDAGLPPFDKRTLKEEAKAAQLAAKLAANNGEDDDDDDNGKENDEYDAKGKPAKRKRSSVSRGESKIAGTRNSSAPKGTVQPAVGGKKAAKDLEKPE